jgi:hypothetical protein
VSDRREPTGSESFGARHPSRWCALLSFADKQRLRRIATDVSIASGIIVSLLVVDQGILAERGAFSVFDNVREEGIVV